MAKTTNTTEGANYTVAITECSRELSAKERIAMKDTSNATKLDVACEGQTLRIVPKDYAVLTVHNEKSDSVDYKNYIIMDENGEKYCTGSDSFWNAFKSIYDEMKDETEAWAIDIYKLDSKNYKGKKFLTCSIV